MNINTEKRLLSIIHKTIVKRANKMNYIEPLPKYSSIVSLSKLNPTKEEINKDFQKLSYHFKHPVFIEFIPSYYELQNCRYSAWYKRYISTYYNLKN